MNRSIEVRTLAGESTAVSISPNLSVADLKATLKKSFPPAEISPNFHLFFKGARLRIDTRIDSDQIENGDFMVLVPFTKKIKEISSHNDSCTPCSTPSFTSPAADSAWHDLMNDLSSLSKPSPGELGNEKGEAFVVESPAKLASLATKRKRDADSSDALRDILCSGAKDGFDQQTRDKICHFVDLVNCLLDSSTGHCLLRREFVKGSEEGKKCVCPLWLKKLLKTFTFLNIFYAFFHAQRKLMSRKVLTEALKNGSRFGLVNVSVLHVEKLSLLCPTMVIMLGKEDKMVTKRGSAIIVCDSSSDSVDSCDMANMPRRQASILAAINGIEKRGISFRTDLWRLLKNFMEKRHLSCSMPRMPSLEDLILMKNENVVPEHAKGKAVKHWSSPSKCHGTSCLEPTEMVDHLRKGMGIDGQIVHVEYIDAKQAVYMDFPNDLSENTKAALKGIGISRLYCHQAEAICASLSGKNVVVATSTSSGKSLCYNLPVLEVLSKNPLACALYVFPTKALAQDQLRALCEMTSGLEIQLNVGVYDGDTSQEHRTWIRHNSRLLITNPDMLHMSILPYHAMFKRILSNLRIIVIDETHVYKGAFGCHTALILRRLRRICFHVYGCDPSFIFSTATSANPREHALELANLQSLELIQNDGSPCGPKYFLLWNPPLRLDSVSNSRNGQEFENKLCTQRSSPIWEASRLFAEMVQHGLRCITFCKTRKLCELVLCYTREIFQETVPNLVESICVYRGGYTHQDRRRIEIELFGGKLRGVAATNALELGIDVGHIDVTLHLGFPGSVASLWQQAGRSGRRLRPSLAIYIAFEGPLDQYFMKFPHKLFKRPVEHCHVDGQNQKVLEQHIACAALELPLCLQYDEKYFGSGLDSAITALKSIGHLNTDQFGAPSTNMWNYIGPQKRPSAAVTIRAIEADKYKVIDQVDNKVLEEIEESKAFFQVYEGAVYMHQGISYLVKTLDLSEKIATCQKADLKYYTRTRDYTDIHIIGGDLAYPLVNESEIERTKTTAQVHACKVTTNWFGFHCIWRSSNQIFDTIELSLPNFSYESEAAWIRIPQSTKTAVEMQNLSFRAGMHAASHALLNIVPLYMLCNASDLGTECANPHETRNIPERLLLYDKHPGGIGISAQIRLLFRELLTASMELVSTCCCSNAAGCPNCVQAFLCSEYNEVLDKRAAIIILEGVIEAENSYFESSTPSKAPCTPN